MIKAIVTTTDDTQAHKDLGKALNLALLALFGAIIPVLGIILGIVAATLASKVTADRNTKAKQSLVENLAIFAIILSVAAGFGYFELYQHKQAELQIQQATTQEDLRLKEAAKSLKQDQLTNCIDTVNKTVAENSQGSHPQAYWDTVLQVKQQSINECQLKYQ